MPPIEDCGPSPATKLRKLDTTQQNPVNLKLLGVDIVLPKQIASHEHLSSFPERPRELPATIPDHFVKDTLAELNTHPRDRNISFQADDHVYFWKGKRVSKSVTQLVHKFTAPFCEEQVISSMRESCNWPRPGYLKTTLSESQKNKLQKIPGGKELLAELQRPERDELKVCRLAFKLRANHASNPDKDADIACALTELGLSREEIIHKWEKARQDGAKEGTWMHAQFQWLLNGGSVPAKTTEVFLLSQFLRLQANTKAFRTEWQVYADSEDLAGSIDYVAKRPDGSVIIVDWKRTSPHRLQRQTCNKFMRTPLSHVPDCTLWHYRLQLNVYKFILEQYYGEAVSDMYIVGTNPEYRDQPFIDNVPTMDVETKTLLANVR
ncbi:ANKRD50 [Symbiodinium natans]|uniref:ANKRD50 protein n=1 Tax=Symbiodinium natans TaxID=878477 RepID=A0A812LDK6_9DINO|nr:ANKRD50 [Symbiodinium natans]